MAATLMKADEDAPRGLQRRLATAPIGRQSTSPPDQPASIRHCL